MEKYIQSLRSYVAAHPPNFGDCDTHSILEMLFCHYSEFNRQDNENIKQGFEKLYRQLDALKKKKKDTVIDIVCFLCQEHEKVSFTEGIKVGVRLANELTG